MTDETEANRESGAVSEQDSFMSKIMQTAPEADKPEHEDDKPEEPDDQEPEVDEAAEEDVSEADDDADAADDPGEEEAEPSEPERFTVKVDGEEIEVTRDELLNGYQRDADYRRKTQALAEQRKQIEQAHQALAQRLNELGSTEEPEPDWTKLADELDPWSFNKKRAEWDTKQRQKAQAAQELQAVTQKQMAERAQRCVEDLPKFIPEWSDRQKMKEGYEAMLRDAPSMFGLDANAVASTTDPAMLRVLHDALAYQRIKAEQGKVVEKRKAAPKKSIKPGSPTSKQAQKAADQREVRKQLRTAGNTAQERDAFVRLISGG